MALKGEINNHKQYLPLIFNITVLIKPFTVNMLQQPCKKLFIHNS